MSCLPLLMPHCMGEDISSISLDQRKLRQHLVSCLEQNNLNSFPQHPDHGTTVRRNKAKCFRIHLMSHAGCQNDMIQTLFSVTSGTIANVFLKHGYALFVIHIIVFYFQYFTYSARVYYYYFDTKNLNAVV